jgi:phage baseplate assembly protein gpV
MVTECLLVEICKCGKASYWYAGNIGEQFWVLCRGGQYYLFSNEYRIIASSDAVIIRTGMVQLSTVVVEV